MFSKRHSVLLLPFIVVATILVATWTLSTAEADSEAGSEPLPLSPKETVSQAWQAAINSGTYKYDTAVEHTQYPAPRLSNSGRQPTTDFLTIAGQIDQSQELLEMTIWQDAGRHPDRGVSVKVENGRTLGRVGNNEWEEMDNIADLFAPDQDPLGFLAFATNVEHLGQETRQLGEHTLIYQQYSFELDSEAYATHKQQEMEAHLQDFGRLPAGLRLSSAELYRRAIGSGELWLDAEGLPVRLSLDLDIPAYRDNGRVVSQITTDLYGLDRTALSTPTAATSAPTFWNTPTLQTTIIANASQTAMILFILLTSSFILFLAIRYWHTPIFYKTIAYLIVFALIVPPLIDAQRMHAFTTNFHEAQLAEEAEHAEAEEIEAAQAQLRTSDWNPNQNPLESAEIRAEARLNKPVNSDLLNTTNNTTIDTTDSDGDGLTDTDEAYWGSCAYPLNSTEYNNSSDCSGVADPTDSDGDTFSDSVEVYDLGSFPAAADTDGDGLSDTLEIGGFTYNNQTWYSDYNEADSNKDGITDGPECLVWYEASPTYDPAAICPDTDNDGTPDLFDDDNDGDGVPDGKDLSPNSHSNQTFTRDEPFYFSANNLEADKPVMLNIHLRPTVDNNLNLYNHVLDWPTNDTQGQITRYLDTTWADTANSTYQSDAANAANGDIRLVPMLEITMPYQEGHYSNLPITTTAPATRVADAAVDTWLDATELDPFSITVDDSSTTSGDLIAYIPLTAVADDYDNTVSFGAQMVYRPNTTSWGNAHEFRVVWLVQMLTDECINEDDDLDTCERQDTMQIIHTYSEDWTLTGLNVTEEHGLDAAVVYEDYDTSRPLEAQLWTASWNLANSFLRGRDCEVVSGNSCGATDGLRDVTVANLDTTINDWFSGENYLNVETFNYDHQAYIGYMVSNEMTRILDENYTSTAAEYNPTVMIVQEYETRDLNLDNYDTAFTDTITFDLDPNEVVKQLYGTISWAPYTYVGGEWVSYDIESYLDLLSAQLGTDDFFTAEDESDESYYEAQGRLVWAQMYYASLVQGSTSLIEVDGTSTFVESIEENLLETDFYERLTPPGTLTGAGYIGSAFAESLQAAKAAYGTGTFFKTLGKTFVSKTAPYTLTYNRQLSGMQTVKINAVSLMVLSLAVLGTALLAYGYASGNQDAFDAGIIILNVVTIAVVSVYALNMIRAMGTAAKAVTGFKATAGAITSAATKFPAMSGIAVGITIGLAWGMFIYQATQTTSAIELQAAIAYAIAQTIIALVLLALDIFGLGIFTLIIALIDAILALMGKTTFTEWLTEVIAEFLFEVNLVITNADATDRMDVRLDSLGLVNDGLGFTVSNSIIYTYTVTNTAKYKRDYDFDTAAYRNVFEYTLQPTEIDQHSGLSLGDQEDEWLDLGERRMRVGDTQAITISMADMGVGLNRSVPFYLTESYLLSYEGCWFIDGYTVVIAGVQVAEVDACTWEKIRDSAHIDLGESQVFDILPSTVEQFARMDWDDSFGRQIDIDADGLPYNDGTDPDYRYFDLDDDGLGDMYEISNGYDAEMADADNDGLTDREELTHYTNPFMADTDEDGLNDYIEVMEGWLIVYDGNKLARVWSDPNVADADEDGLDDLDEFLFGFNPWVATDPSIIETLVQFDDLTVNEETNLQLLLRMEENADAQVFGDSSGNNLRGRCDDAAGQCPTAEVTGRYGNSLFFDGNDAVTTDLAQDVEQFTMAAWVYNSADDNGFKAIMGYQEGATNETRAPGMWVYQQTKIHAGLSDGSTWGFLTTDDILTQNQWQHIAATFDGETYRIYVDGVDAYNTTALSGMDSIPFTGYNIGSVNDNFYFEGNIDEAAFFDRALSADEVSDLMNGRYNPNDLYAAPGTELTYRATITNSTSTNATGFLVPETGYIDPALPDPLLALSFEKEQRIAYFENSIETDKTPMFCTAAEDACPASGQEGQIGSSVAFDGVNDYLTMPGLIGRYDETYSILFWLYVESIPAAGEIAMILDTEGTDESAMDIYLNSDGKLVIEGAELGTITSGYNFGNNLNKWVHVAYNGGRLYINYAENGNSFADDPLTVGNGRLGNSMDGNSPFHGRIDELVVFNNNLDDGTGGSATSINEVQLIAGGDYILHEGDNTYNLEIAEAVYSFEELIELDTTIFYNNISTGESAICTPPACPVLTESDGGYSGRGILFDGIDDSLTQNGSIITSAYAEYVFYIKPLSYPAAGEVAYLYDTIATGQDENYSLNLYIDENGYINYENDVFSLTTTTAAALDQWSQVRMWYNGNSSAYNVRLSVNGAQVNSGRCAISSGCRDEMQFIGPGTIGNNVAADSPFHGYMDEISIVIGDYDFNVPGNSIGYENLANDLRTASCDEFSICASVAEGRYGDGAEFDGVDDYLNLGPVFDSDPSSFTLGLWFKMDEQTYYHRIIEQADGSGDGRVWLAITDTGQLYTFLSSTYIGGGNPSVGDWHYATLTYDGTTLRLYLNGQLTNSSNVTPIFSDGDVLMGISEDFRLAFNGTMDELIILTEAADEALINFLMASTYPALETANDFETYTAGPVSSVEASGTASIADNLPTSRYQFDLEVEAALELQTQIDFPVIDNNSANLSLFIPFEDTPGSTYFDNLIPYEGFSNIIYDVEAKCYNSSCPTAGLRGIIGRSADFDGLNDFIEIDFADDEFNGDKGSLPGIYSASVWVKGKKGTILDSRSSIVDDNAVRIDFGQVYQYEIDGDNNITTYETAFDMPIDEWTHLAFVIDPSNSNTGTVYVNGQPVASGTHFTDDSTDLWTIGANFGQQNFFEGQLDDLRVYETTLSAADVLALYDESPPVLRFEFDEDDTATTFADKSINQLIGYPEPITSFNSTLNETVTTLSPSPGTDGKIGNTAFFDGSGFIEIDEDPLGALSNDLTIMAWIKPEDTSSTQRIISSGRNNSSNGIGFGLYDSGLIFTTYAVKDYNFEVTVEEDLWQHVAVTLDSNNDAHFYLDGEFVGTITHNRAGSVNSDDLLYIGANQETDGSLTQQFIGQIDELAVYGRTLTEAEISGIFLQEFRWYRANSYNEIQVDLEAPVIEYLSDATYRSTGYIQLSVATRDTHSYINTFDFGVKGPNDSDFSWQSAPVCGEAAASNSAWCPNFDTADYGGEGVYEVQFRVVDAVGNETTSVAYTLYVDGQAPTTTDALNQAVNLTEIATLEWTLSLSGNVSDPDVDTGNGIVGSGLVSNTLKLGLFDTSGGLIDDGWQSVTLNGTAWSIDYHLAGARPSGTYTVKLKAEDEVGNNAILEIGTVTLDERAPTAKVNAWERPSEAITETTTINGVAVEQPDWGDVLAEYHFETDANATTFYDSSDNSYHATCAGSGDCPTADLTGAFGQALAFDGIDDALAIADDDALDFGLDDDFTIAVWVKADPTQNTTAVVGNSIIEKWSGDGPYPFVIRYLNQTTTDNGKIRVARYNGTDSAFMDSTATINDGAFHHIVFSKQGETLYLYIDGVLDSTAADLTTGTIANSSPIYIGRRGNRTEQFFTGSVDELYIYDRALTDAEIYALAQNEVEGVSSVEVLVEEQDLSSSAQDAAFDGAAATWQQATLNNGSWSYPMPTNTEGFYTVQLRTTDNNGNTADEGLIWRGTIDDVAPSISAFGFQVGGGNVTQTEYNFTFTDFILDFDSLDQPCEVDELDIRYYEDEALPQDGSPYRVNALCRVDGHETSRDFTACDIFGNCTTVTVNPTFAPFSAIKIQAPADGANIVQNETFTITVEVYDPMMMMNPIELYANNAPVDIFVPMEPSNEISWSVEWSSGDLGDVELEARMTGGSTGMTSDKITISIIEDPLTDLFVTVDGTGDGFVTSDPAGIACEDDCDEQYLSSTVVTLTATANTGSTFTGWSGACSGTADCVVILNDVTNVTATFTLNQYDLTVIPTGNGTGTVTSEPNNLIDCGLDCTETLDHGTVVTLTATAGLESQFAGWSGICAGVAECVVTMDAVKTVSANFALNQYDLTAAVTGDGNGTVTSNPTGLDCGADCSESYAYGTAITLTATPDGASIFTGWEGSCSGQTCSLTMDNTKAVTATFAQANYDLTVAVLGDGNGTISSDPAGISCEADCTETYAYGTVVTLTASYDDTQMALTWSGSCTSAVGDSCTVTMDQAHAAVATFISGSFSLGTNIAGNGNGAVSSDPAGIICDEAGGVCNAAFTASDTITLTATAGLESVFTGWSGICSGTADCVITLSQTEQVTATFTLNQYDLIVNTSGNGTGTITSNPAGIDCGLTCTTTLDYGSVITLTATPDAETTFAGWSGACSGTGTCVVTISETTEVTAEFQLNFYELTVEKDGTGDGLVTSEPAGIGCGNDCDELYAFGTIITLTTTPNSGAVFSGWSGACAGMDDCTVTVDQAQMVTATFTLLTHTLTVNKTGTGAGSISSNPAGIDCGSSCTAVFDHNTLVTLTATPQAGSTFEGWSGACTGTTSCVVTMAEAQTVTAVFDLVPAITNTLTVTLTGDGSGTVSSDPVGISCGDNCSASFDENTIVTLTATPDAGSLFDGWTGACSGTAACTITMDMAHTVTASFKQEEPTSTRYTLFLPLVTR